MKPARFEYVAAATLEEALEALASDEGARVLAGGQSLVPLMNLRLARPTLLVDLNGVGGLGGCEVRNGTIRLGAMVRHRDLESAPAVAGHAPLVAEAAALIGHVHIRNRGTLGGSLAHADPVAELPATLVALGGSVVARRQGGERAVPAAELFLGPFTTALAPDELLTAVEFPVRGPGDGWAFSEFARRHGDFATAGIAVVVSRDESGACRGVRMAGCGVAPTPVDLSAVADFLVGETKLTDAAPTELGRRVARAVEPSEDVHGSREYRRELSAVLAADAWRRAWERAQPARGSPVRGENP